MEPGVSIKERNSQIFQIVNIKYHKALWHLSAAFILLPIIVMFVQQEKRKEGLVQNELTALSSGDPYISGNTWLCKNTFLASAPKENQIRSHYG